MDNQGVADAPHMVFLGFGKYVRSDRIFAIEPLRHEDRRSWFVYVVKLDAQLDRGAVMDALRREGIATAEYVPCIHLQPYMHERFGFAAGLCPVAEETASRTMALPFFTQIEPADQERVVEVLQAATAGV